MLSYFRRRLWVLLLSAAAASVCWKWVPGTPADRIAVEGMARGFANPPFHFSGNGSHTDPWALRTLSPYTLPATGNAPLVISLGDDPENYFQESPPAPIDLAVVLSNIQRLGAKKAASAAVLAWTDPDPISLAALENTLDRFEAVVTATPLSRGAVPSSIPPQFRRASIPLEDVRGDATGLPVVNRIPIPGVILGGEKALAGFTTLDSEEPGEKIPLVARWDDRAVFAFPVMAVLLRHDLPIGGVEVRPGSHLKLGENGPVIPIDRFGRLSAPLKEVEPFEVISAELLIDGGDELFPKTAPDPVILRDDHSAAEAPAREFSANLASMISAIASEAGLSPPQEFRRLPTAWEAGILAAFAALLAGFCSLPPFARNIVFLGASGAVISAQWIALGTTESWLPGLPALAALAAGWLFSHIPGREKPKPEPPPEKTTTGKTPPKKSPPQKTAAKKAAKKKTPAKKAARKRRPPSAS